MFMYSLIIEFKTDLEFLKENLGKYKLLYVKIKIKAILNEITRQLKPYMIKDEPYLKVFCENNEDYDFIVKRRDKLHDFFFSNSHEALRGNISAIKNLNDRLIKMALKRPFKDLTIMQILNSLGIFVSYEIITI